jgi:hypothetical protein
MNGLRSLSNTRYESSGSIFGDGIYTTNSREVASQFAKVNGMMWGGILTLLQPQLHTSTIPPAKIPCTYSTIVQLDAIAHPDNVVTKNGVQLHGVGHDIAPSCYVVVKNPSHLQIKKLIVAPIEMHQSSDWIYMISFFLLFSFFVFYFLVT